ncbi:MAG TPA: hypothetical protein VGJ91_19865, partial [Polyangiaceae bacterium]
MSSSRASLRQLAPLGWWAIFLAAAAFLQLIQVVPFDGDTSYHIAVARLTRQYGLLSEFPWTPWSWLADHYGDKELGFHLLIVPIATLSPKLIALVIGTLLGALVLGTVRAVLSAEGTRFAGVWALLALLCSGGFLVRIALVRPHLLAITLALWLTWAAVKGRTLHAALAGLLFPLCYVGWNQVPILLAIAACASWLADRRPAWRTYAATVGGLVAGVLVHPNFPNNARFAWLTSIDVLFGHAWTGTVGFEMGGEFKPLAAGALLRLLGVPILLALGASLLAWRHRKTDPLPLTFALAALAYLLVTLRTQRFLEYFVPFAVTAAGLAARWAPPRLDARLILAGSTLYTGLFGLGPVLQFRTRSELFPAAVSEGLRRAIPLGARVCTCDWEFTGEMMLALPERAFLVALDPVLFWKKDPDAYRAWFEMTHGGPGDPAHVIRDVLHSRYVLCD